MRKMWKKKEGFTLIELLIVVAIIGILAGIAIPNFLGARNRARISRVFADFRTIGTALESYYVDNTEYPPDTPAAGDWYDPLVPEYITSMPDDPFNAGNPYGYYTDAAATVAGDAWLVLSYGPDGEEDVTDTVAGFDWDAAVSGQLGGADAPRDADGDLYGYGLGEGADGWYDPEDGAASAGDIGRAGP